MLSRVQSRMLGVAMQTHHCLHTSSTIHGTSRETPGSAQEVFTAVTNMAA